MEAAHLLEGGRREIGTKRLDSAEHTATCTPAQEIRVHQRTVAAHVAEGIATIGDNLAAGSRSCSAAGRRHYRAAVDRIAADLCNLLGCNLPGLRLDVMAGPTLIKSLREIAESHWRLGDALVQACELGKTGWEGEVRAREILRGWPWCQ